EREGVQADFDDVFRRSPAALPRVSVMLKDWLQLCPDSAVAMVSAHVAKMADLMADWTSRGWSIRTRADLEDYTYSVAGLVGEMLAQLWHWFDGTDSDVEKAVA